MPPLFAFTDGLAASPGPFAALAPAPVVADSPAATRDQVERALLDEGPATGYVPSLPIAQFTNAEHDLPPIWRYMWDLPAMLLHPRVSQALSYYRGGIAGAKFRVTASSPAVKKFVEDELARFWTHSRDQVQDHGYSWGWAGCQSDYTIRNGLLCSDQLDAFESRDVQPLTVNGKYVGFRVNHVNAADGRGHADYWGPGRAPARGFWYTHRPRKGRMYGFSVPYPSWRPWRRAAGRDGAEQSIDAAFYRFGCAGPVVRVPHEDTTAKNQPPGPARQSAMQKGQEFAEQAKAGAGICFSSRMIEGTDKYAWSVEWPKHSFEGGPFLDYLDALNKQIDAGIGVPSELIEASDTGSGFSGRRIPLEGYLATQQTNATSIVRQWKEQQVDPLVRWNFGRHAWFDVEVESLLDSWRQSGGGPQTGGAAGDGNADPDSQANGPHAAVDSQDEDASRGDRWKINPATGSKYHAAQLSTDGPMAQETMPAEPAPLGCALLELPPDLADKVLALAAEIDPEDIVPDGREDRPHVTARFGFLSMLPDGLTKNVAAAVHGMGPVTVRLGPTGVFAARETGADHDVVYVTVESPALHALHRLLADVPHIDTHPRFCPHVTLAYVAPGRGLYYAGDEDLDGETVELDTLTVSDGDKRRSRIKLDGAIDAVAVEMSTSVPVEPEADDWLADGNDPDFEHRKAVAAIADGRHDDVHAALLAAIALLMATGNEWWKSIDWAAFDRDVAAGIDPIFAAHDEAARLAAKRAGVAFDSLHDATVSDKRTMKERLAANIVASVRAGIERVVAWAKSNDIADADVSRILEATAGMGERQVDAVLANWEETHKKKGGDKVLASVAAAGVLGIAISGLLGEASEKADATIRRGAGDALWNAVQAGQVAAGKQLTGERAKIKPVQEPRRPVEPPAEPTGEDIAESEIADAPAGSTKTWWTERDGHVCEVCEELHGVTVPVDDPFITKDGREIQHPGAHPSCRCHITIDAGG